MEKNSNLKFSFSADQGMLEGEERLPDLRDGLLRQDLARPRPRLLHDPLRAAATDRDETRRRRQRRSLVRRRARVRGHRVPLQRLADDADDAEETSGRDLELFGGNR